MADEEAQIQEDQSFWASGVPSEAEPWTSFGDPVEWPAGDDSVTPLVEDDLAAFPGDPQPEQAVSQSPGDELWLSGLDLGELAEAPSAGHETDLDVDLPLDPLPDSLWAPEPLGADPVGPDTVISGPVVPEPVVADGPMLVTSTLPAPQRVPASSPTSATSTSSLPPPPSPSVYAEAEPDAEGGARWRRFLDLRNGNAGIVALVVLASLVLVGMFLSARARNDVSTANTPARPSGEIAARRPLNTVPLSTSTTTANSTTTTTTSPPGVSLSDLLLPGGVGAGDAAPGAGAGAGAGAGGAAAAGAGASGAGAGAGPGPRISTPATTAAPSRQAAPSGGGGGGGGAATQPPAEPPPTTRAPTVTSPPDTSPVDTTQPPTTRRTPPRDLPTVTFTVPTTEPTTDTTLFTRPSIPRPSIPDVDGD